MASIIKLRPFATRGLSYAPRIMSALSTNPELWWHDDPFFSSNSLWNRPPTTPDFHRPVRVVENDQVWKLSCDLPGIKAKDVSVTSDGTSVQIAASRHYVVGKEDSKTTIKKSRFIQTFPIHSHHVDVSQIKANLADGVLIVTAPKKTETDNQSIAITTNPHKAEDLVVDGTVDVDDEEDVILEEAEEEFESIDVKDTSNAKAKK